MLFPVCVGKKHCDTQANDIAHKLEIWYEARALNNHHRHTSELDKEESIEVESSDEEEHEAVVEAEKENESDDAEVEAEEDVEEEDTTLTGLEGEALVTFTDLLLLYKQERSIRYRSSPITAIRLGQVIRSAAEERREMREI